MKKGFTLIELLAVIVILGIILTFAIMSVSGFIEKSEKQSLIKEADSILDVVRYQISSGEELLKEYNITNGSFVEENKFSYTGGLPESGKILVRNTDELSIAISDGYWCVSKSYLDKNYKIYKNEGTCNPTLDITTDSEMAKCFTFDDNSSPGYGELTGLAISDYICSSKEIVIPSTYNKQPIIGVKSMNCTDCITKVDMGYATNLKYIGVLAFRNVGLEEVILSESIDIISFNSFYDNNITNLIIPSEVDIIYSNAFTKNKLRSLILLGNTTNIGENAFSDNLLPDSQAFIYDNSDQGYLISYGGEKRDNVIIPNKTTRVGREVFANIGLNSVIIPSSVVKIDYGAFSYNNLTSITIPSTVTNIGYSSFSYNNLTSITIPSTVTSIEGYAFYKANTSNENLTSIIYSGTTLYDWNRIINGSSGTPFVTGVVNSFLGNVTISAN